MSGEATVTEGATLASTEDPITRSKFNSAAKPTVRVAESAIGSREMVAGSNVLLAKVTGVDMNSTADQSVDMPTGDYTVEKILVTNPSINLDTAAGGVYTGSSKGGDVLVAATQDYSGLTASNKYDELTLTSTANTDVLASDPVYISLTTAQGSAATADFYFFGHFLK